MAARNIKIIKDEEKPETPELLASSIVAIGNAFKQLKKHGLTDKAIVTLLSAMDGMSRVPKSDIYLVLENLPKLSGYYVKPPKK
jgi:hypothetical protein